MLFTPSQAYMPNRHRQRSALRTFFPSSFSPPDPKEPLRRGILFSSVATVLLLIGTILTWLGFNDVFGGKISMTGPLLIALALLMLLLSLRQFMLARRRNRTMNEPLQMEAVNTGGVTAVVVDHDDGNGAATIVVETWDSEEPTHDSISCRNNNDLAPPSYMDIAQSCSSNCPSFMSHEDHNEAPPTYEETCGMYSSDTSLNNMCMHHASSPFEGSPSRQLPTHSGYKFFAHELTCHHNYETCPGSEHAGAFLHTQCPAPCASQPLSHYQTPATCPESNASPAGLCTKPHVTGSTASHSLHFLACRPEATDPNPQPASFATNGKPPEWSRRSFSSIPSYTCLLSESGEVSSHVFDTSSIIEEMMPLLAVQGPGREVEKADLGTGAGIVPTRSHSMSSVNTCRQGVPYMAGASSPRTAALPSQLLHGKQVSSGDFIPGWTHQHLVPDVASMKPAIDWQLGQEQDISLAGFLPAQSAQLSDLGLLQSQPGQTNSSTSSSPSSWNVSNSEDTNDHGQLLPLLEVHLDMHSRQRSANITTTFHDSTPGAFHDSSCSPATFHDSSCPPARSMISNTQDVQETI